MNARPLSRADQVRTEQPGCLHSTMDLYRTCYKLSPMVGSELIADCFELALAARELDMRASPYDLSSYGYEPVPVETAEGRALYAREQARLSERAQPLRRELLAVCERLLEMSC